VNARPKLIIGGHCSVCGRDVSDCSCTVEDIHDWLEDQYMLPMTPIEFGAANPIPVVGDPRSGRPVDGEADKLGTTAVVDAFDGHGPTGVCADGDPQLGADLPTRAGALASC
jgi:hypothetical protein